MLLRLRAEPNVRRRPPLVQRLTDDEFAVGKGPLDARGVAALQRRAGNRAVTAMLAPAVQRCGPGGCAEREPEQEETAARQGIAEVAEEPLMGAQALPVQRAATWANGTVRETNNLATVVTTGAPAGLTTPKINGTVTSTGDLVRSSLVAPTLTTAAVPAGGFDSEVNVVPANVGSFDELVLGAGPWRTTWTKAAFHTTFPTVPGCTGAGATRFRAAGDPGDAAMKSANRRHEDHHASDMQAAFNDIIVPWDQKVTNAKTAGTKFHGATAAAAEAALWTAMGGTRDEIADAFTTRVVNDIDAFHATPAGGPVSLSPTKNPGANSNCSLSWAYFVNPS
ncbi:hypothetical protein [Phytomonospora endophytica]|uniref:Uncharacterized protein n=1 Tax=Phytomonospora endophytica TaxID=714109 RepID=A0A841FKZ6_9ACTN|nr:hypothetical protein [Phytomonospora endophytica]MBB6033309.1 hypothetical protein [Phytomonospora endophytica]GIG65536.1 hypothetical protein Pen01_18310 [Phytomonospora endophytica]